ncbi:MAG: hypothetical protein Q8Q02_06310 [Nocardioides sp.]|nr:hypothetical protein [Nocardioides sp.]
MPGAHIPSTSRRCCALEHLEKVEDVPATNLDDVVPARRHFVTAAVVLITGAGWIHLLSAEDHRSHSYVAAFFVSTAVLQVSWAALVLYKVTRRLLLMALVGNLGLVLLWVISRTTGVVFVSGVRHVEPVGIPDAAASGLELMAAAALGLLLATRRGDLTVPVARILVAGTASLTLLLVVVAGATGTTHHHDYHGPRA